MRDESESIHPAARELLRRLRPGLRRAILAVFIAAAAVCPVRAWASGAQEEDPSAAFLPVLARQGFYGTEVRLSDSAASLVYENLSQRSDAAAMGTALAPLVSAFPERKEWRVLPTRRGIPLLCLRVLGRSCPPSSFPPEAGWDVTFASGYSMPRKPDTQGIPLHRRIDLVIHPQVKAVFGQPLDRFRLQANLAPEVIATVARGTVLSAQAVFPLEDEFARFSRLGGDGIRPGRVALSTLWKPRGRWLALADLGLFDEYRYGGSLEVMRPTKTGRWTLGGQVGCTGYLAYRHEDDVWVYSDPTLWTALLEIGLHLAWKDTAFKVSAGQFLYQDAGARVDMERTFGWVRLGVFGISTTAGTTGGAQVRIALSRPRWRVAERVSVGLPTSLPWAYRFHVNECGYVLDGRHRIEDVIGDLYPAHISNCVEELAAAYESSGQADIPRAGYQFPASTAERERSAEQVSEP